MKSNVNISLLAACELAQVTQDGKLSLLGIFSRLTARVIPLTIPRFYLVAMLSGEPLTEHQVSFQLLRPNSTDGIQEYQAKVRFGYDGQANVLNELTNISIHDYGQHTIVINVDGARLRTSSLTVSEEGDNSSLKPRPHRVVN